MVQKIATEIYNVTASVLNICCLEAILSVHILTSVGEVRCKRSARNAMENFKFLENMHREDHTFLTGIDEITFMDLP